MKIAGKSESRRRRRRHGRFRRWLVRPFFWGLAVLVLAFFLILVYLQSDDFERRISAFAIDWLGDRLQREVKAAEVSLELFPLAVAVEELEISGLRPESPPFLTAASVLVEATVGSLLRPGVVVDHILVIEPRLAIGFDEDGSHDAPRWSRRRDRSARVYPFDVEIGLLEIVQGSFALEDQRYPLSLSARNVQAELGGGDGLELRGQARASDVEVVLPQGRPYLGGVVVDVSVRSGRVDVRQARVSGPDLTGTLSGIWQWRDTKDVDLRVVADSRLEILDRLGYLEGFGRGAFRFEGNFRRRPGEWFLDGDISSPSLTVLDRQLGALSGGVFGDQQGVRIQIDSGRYGEGSIAGSVLISLAAEGERPVDVDLELSNVDLTRLLQDQAIPVRGLAGLVSGRFGYQFPRSRPREGNGWADLGVRAPAAVDAGLPVSGSAPFSIGDGVIRSEAIRLVGESQLLLTSGHYDLATGSGLFDYSIETGRAEELFPLLGLTNDEPQLWQPLSGSGSLTGRLTIGEGETSTTVQINLDGVRAKGFTADRVQGGLRVERRGVEDLRLELTRPAAAMIVAGHIPYDNEPEAPPLELTIDAAAWPLEDIRAWLPQDPGLAGLFTGGLEIFGTTEAVEGTVEGVLEAVVWGPLEAQSLDAEFEFNSERVHLRRAQLGLGSGSLSAEGDVDLADGTLSLRFSSDPLDLATMPVVGDLPGSLVGEVEIFADLGGVWESPQLEATLVFREIGVGGESTDSGAASRAELVWRDGRLDVDGAVSDLLDFSGGGRLDRQGVDLDIAVESDRLDNVLALLVGAPASGMAGRAAGAFRVIGGQEQGSLPAAVLELDRLSLERGEQQLQNLEPVVIEFERDGIWLRSVYLGERETESEAFFVGRVRRGETTSMDIDVQASLASEWFAAFVPGVEAESGVFDVIGSIGGTPERLLLNGQGELNGAKAFIEGFANVFTDVGGLVLFYPNRIVLDSSFAAVAGGSLRAGGVIDLTPSGDASYRFQFQGDDLSLRYPEGWVIRGDAEVTLASSASGRQISGVARLDGATYLQDVQLLKALFERRRLEEGDVEPWRSETQLNLVVELAEGLRVKNNLADLQGSAALVVRGSLARPVLFGTVELNREGRLVYQGQEYKVERGSLNFTNPYRIEPVLDLVATTDLREYDVTLTLSGTPDRLQAEFASDPPLAELEVLALLTGGRDPKSRAPDQSTSGVDSVAAESFLYGQATSLIAGRFNRLFGLDQLRIDPLTSSTGDLSSARITVGKQLSRDVFVTYSYDPSQTEEQILELEWSINRSLMLVLTQNGDGTYAVDARWEKAL